MKIDNKVVLITGASSGIGEALVKEFAQHHCHLILVSRNQEKLKQIMQEISYPSNQFLIVPFDLTKYKECPLWFRRLFKNIQRLM
jgi:dehydrogenase/reductase SDR family protein 7B